MCVSPCVYVEEYIFFIAWINQAKELNTLHYTVCLSEKTKGEEAANKQEN